MYISAIIKLPVVIRIFTQRQYDNFFTNFINSLLRIILILRVYYVKKCELIIYIINH